MFGTASQWYCMCVMCIFLCLHIAVCTHVYVAQIPEYEATCTLFTRSEAMATKSFILLANEATIRERRLLGLLAPQHIQV